MRRSLASLTSVLAIAASTACGGDAAALQSEILTPKPPAEPRINGAKVFGARTGRPILYTIAATGRRPMTFAAEGLPPGARFDGKTGRISGAVAARGTYRITLRAENELGHAERELPLKLAAACAPLAQLSRTTGDLVDYWDRSQMDEGIRKWAVGVREVMIEHDAFAPYQRPGHWNHACNLRIGLLGGWRDKPLEPSHLTPDEQYSHVSLWCLWSSPMIIGTPIERLDEFTLGLLTNDEVIEINQDPLGRQALRREAGGGEILVKEMEDGTLAIGLFNPGPQTATISVGWADLGLKGPRRIRDLWRQKDLGVFDGRFEAPVRPHGVVLVRAFPAGPR